MTTIAPPICMTCRHFRREESGFHCDAFPDGIPQDIIESVHDHHKPYPGDNGIIYEPLDPTETSG